jgi:hypothetical protein
MELYTTSSRGLGRIAGVLLLLHLATGLMVPYILLLPVQAVFLEVAAGMEDRVRLSVLLLFIGGAVPVAISTVLWPIVRQRDYRLGLWLLALCVANLALQVTENAQWLSMLSVSQAYAGAGADDPTLARTLEMVVRSGWKWAHYGHLFVVVGWLFVLFATLFRTGLVPRALAAIGMVTCLLQLVGITLPQFGGYAMPFPEAFGMPLGLAIILLAAWLMAVGFTGPSAPPAVEPLEGVVPLP